MSREAYFDLVSLSSMNGSKIENQGGWEGLYTSFRGLELWETDGNGKDLDSGHLQGRIGVIKGSISNLDTSDRRDLANSLSTLLRPTKTASRSTVIDHDNKDLIITGTVKEINLLLLVCTFDLYLLRSDRLKLVNVKGG